MGNNKQTTNIITNNVEYIGQFSQPWSIHTNWYNMSSVSEQLTNLIVPLMKLVPNEQWNAGEENKSPTTHHPNLQHLSGINKYITNTGR